MANVFICYDREDRDFAEVVQAKLERARHTTAMDFDILNAGDDWQDRLDDAIRRAHALVVIMTPEARQSEYVAYEWAFALGATVTVIPLELKKTTFSPRLDTLHRLDFTNGARPWDTLLAQVQIAAAARPDTSLDVDPGAPPAVKHAARAIDGLDAAERSAAIRTLGQMNHPAARDILARALDHAISDVRLAAACYFPDHSDPRIVPGLLAAYQEDHEARPSFKWFEHEWLGPRLEAVGPAAVPHVLETLPRVHWLRIELLDTLSVIADASTLPALYDMLRDEEPYTRRTAVVTIGRIGDPNAAGALIAALDDEDANVRKAAATSLGAMRSDAAVPGLIALLGEDTRSVQEAAAQALGEIGDRAAVPALTTAVVENEYDVRGAAARALAKIGDPAAVPQLRAVLESHGDAPEMVTEPIGAIMLALAQFHDTESFPLIEQRLIEGRSGSFGAFGEVCDQLAQAGDEGIAVVIRALQQAKSSTVGERAARALGRVRTPAAVQALKEWRRKRR